MQLIKSPSRRDFKLALIPIANSEEESIDGFDFTENEKTRQPRTKRCCNEWHITLEKSFENM